MTNRSINKIELDFQLSNFSVLSFNVNIENQNFLINIKVLQQLLHFIRE